MAMTLALSNGGTGPLARAVATPFLRGGLTPQATLVKVSAPSGGGRRIVTGARLRQAHLIALDSTGNREYVAGCRDRSGVWSEASNKTTLAVANYGGGAAPSTIGSGVDEDIEIMEPAATFPDLSVGSGIIKTYRTLVDGGFAGNTRRSKWQAPRAAFKVMMRLLDPDQAALLHRWFQALNGPLRPFYFDFTDPNTGVETRYIVRFRDPSIVDRITAPDLSTLEFNLIEEPRQTVAGDV